MKAVFFVGEPGVGKTTLVRSILGMSPNGELPMGSCLIQKPKWTMVSHHRLMNIAAAGHYTGAPFDGGDTVPYNGVAAAMDYMLDRRLELAFAFFDGDRFSHAGVLTQLRLLEIEALCVQLKLPPETAHFRRLDRAARAGAKPQNEAWVKGRITKAARFAEKFDEGKLHTFDADQAGLDLKTEVTDWLERHIPNG